MLPDNPGLPTCAPLSRTCWRRANRSSALGAWSAVKDRQGVRVHRTLRYWRTSRTLEHTLEVTAAENDVRTGTRRAAGGWGWAFTILLLLSAGMASVPGGSDSDSTVRDFYTAHAAVVIAAQVVSVLASATFVLFTLTLRQRGPGFRARLGRLEAAGLAVAAASVLTVVPPLWLSVVADSASRSAVHRLAVASDLVDVVLFLTIGVFAGALAAAASATWFKGLAALVSVLAMARALESLLGFETLELAAPLAFVALVVLVSTLVLLRRPLVLSR